MGKRSRSLSACCRRRLSSSASSMTFLLNFHEPSLYHAFIVIFLEFFSWGLLTVPVINVLAENFPANKFLMNGLILGLKGILSFLSSPLIGAASDVFGRKPFLLLTVFFTCMPIPCLIISPWWYFALFTISGLFSVTFTVVLAFVADITERDERTTATGLISASFSAALVTSPALGAYLSRIYSDDAVVFLATIIAVFDVLFILLCVPESLKTTSGKAANATTENVLNGCQASDPFFIFRFLRTESTICRLSLIVFLSYLSEAGEFSVIFVYLRLVVAFSPESVALFIAFVGVLSVFSQTGFLSSITQRAGPKSAITLGLIFQFVQLILYGIGSAHWIMWLAGLFAALSQMTYPAISAFVSLQTDKELQGTVQGLLSGIRGLCQGIGPALFGFIFYAVGMDLNSDEQNAGHIGVGPQFPIPNIRLQPFDKIISPAKNSSQERISIDSTGPVPGPPFLCGALLVFVAILLNWTLSAGRKKLIRRQNSRLADTALLIDRHDLLLPTSKEAEE